VALRKREAVGESFLRRLLFHYTDDLLLVIWFEEQIRY